MNISNEFLSNNFKINLKLIDWARFIRAKSLSICFIYYDLLSTEPMSYAHRAFISKMICESLDKFMDTHKKISNTVENPLKISFDANPAHNYTLKTPQEHTHRRRILLKIDLN